MNPVLLGELMHSIYYCATLKGVKKMKMVTWMKCLWVMASLFLYAFAQPLDGFTIGGGVLEENQSGQFPIYFQDVSGTPIDSGTRFVGAIYLEFNTEGQFLESASFERAGILTSASVLLEIEEIELENDRIRWGILFTSPPIFNLNQPLPGDLIGYLNLTAAAGSAGQTIVLAPVDQGVFITEEVGSPTLYLSEGELFGDFETVQIQGGVSNPPPTINNFNATPSNIMPGQSSTLAWSVSNASSISIEPAVGPVGPNGSRIVSPTETTSYEISATNDFGVSNRSVLVTVVSQQNEIEINSFSATPSTIDSGDSATLNWNVSNADNIIIERGSEIIINTSSNVGSTVVFPDTTSSYTLTASAEGLSNKTRTTTISVNSSSQVVVEAFIAERTNINFQETTKISWLVTGASSIRLSETPKGGITRDLGSQTSSGERLVQPLVDTQYTITGTSTDGSASRTITVYVAANDALKVSPSVLEFDNSTDSLEIEIFNAINRPLFWQLISSPDWMTFSESQGTVTNAVQKITVTVDRQWLVKGRNEGDLLFMAGEDQVYLPVTLEYDGSTNSVFVYPFLQADGLRNTNLSVINLEPSAVTYRLEFFNQDGSPIGVAENGSLAKFASLTRNFSGSVTGKGWARLIIADIPNAKVTGIIAIRSQDGEELAAYSPVAISQEHVFVPHLAKDPAFFTQGALVNVSGVEDSFSFVDRNVESPILELGSNMQVDFDFRADIFSGSIPENGWGAISAADPTTSFGAVEIFGRNSAESRQSVAVELDAKMSNTLWFPHIAADTNLFWTGLIIINPNSNSVSVNYSVFDSDGIQLPGRASEAYQPGQKRTFLIDASIKSFGEGATWLEASSTDGPLIGYVLYGSLPEVADRFSGFQSSKSTFKNLCFPHIEEATVPGSYTGLAVVNAEDATNNIQFRLIGPDGQTKAQEFVLLMPKQKYVNLAQNLFSEYLQDSSFLKDDKIIVLGTKQLAGFEVFGNGTKTMGSVLAIGYE